MMCEDRYELILPIETSDMPSEEWLLDASPILFQDRMMSDTVTGEHSYSSAQQEVHMVLPDIKMEEDDMDSEIFSAVPVSTATGQQDLVQIKEEVASPPQSPIVSPVGRIMSASSVKRKCRSGSASSLATKAAPGSSLLRVPQPSLNNSTTLTIEPVRVKVEPGLNCLPLSPPSSVSNDSESDGSISPVHPSQMSCPVPTSNPTSSPKCRKISGPSAQLTSQLISRQSNSRSGVLSLTDEEKRTLIAEGYPVPTKLPLSKAEERSLKKIRRKIKNKISAQESRRKKKEYMDALEKKVENLTADNRELKIRYDRLLQKNVALVEQLRLAQSSLDGGVPVEENVDEIINITDVVEDVSA